MIQLSKQGLLGSLDTQESALAFARSNTFSLRNLLHHDLFDLVSSRLKCCGWETRDDGKIAREATPHDPALAEMLNFVSNTTEFLALIRQITQFKEITHFGGRVYKMEPYSEHFDSWHADIGKEQDRLVGMSINLSPRPYKGGLFMLRDEASGNVLCRLANSGFGDAIFFRISPKLKHMVSQLEGGESKIAFAGWFRSGGLDFYSQLLQRSRHANS